MLGKRDNLFSQGKRKKRDYRKASVGPNLGGYDAHGNRHSRRSIKRPTAAPQQRQAMRPAPAGKTGEISHVNPRTNTRETVAEYTRRSQRKVKAQRAPLEIPVRGILLAIVAVVAAIAVAAGVASFVFQGSINSRIALDDGAVKGALTAPQEGEPYFVLVAGQLGTLPTVEGADTLTLVRVDEKAKTACFISIPGNLVWTLSDGEAGVIGNEPRVGGDAGLIQDVAALAEVGISHYIKFDEQSLASLVDALGGLDMKLDQEVDDPESTPIYLPAGQQHLSGEQVVALCKAHNYLNPYDTRAQNQMAVLGAIWQACEAAEGLGSQQSTLDTIAGTFRTDMTSAELGTLLSTFENLDASTIPRAIVPGYAGWESGVLYYNLAPQGWKNMMEKVKAGEDPNTKSEAVKNVIPSEYKIIVKNGSGVTGAADQVASRLQEAGYQVVETGNTDQFAYGETLVIYRNENGAIAAEAVVDALGVGRPVSAGIYYEFETDLQVIVGQDWK